MSESWANSGVDLHLPLDGGYGRRAELEHALRDAIRAGRLAPRTRVPSTRGLAVETGLSRGTVQAAYEQLVAEGYLTARRGAGTEVAEFEPGGHEPAPVPAETEMEPEYDLRPGGPDVSSFPTAAWLRATRRVLGSAPADAFDYGDPRGRLELRRALADYLGRTRGVVASPERIVVTSGYVQALALLTRVLSDAGTGRMAMEDPGLDLHREVVRRSGGIVLPAPVDEMGIRASLLGADADAAVVTAAHHYPTGVALHPSRRQTLVAWARASAGLIVEDDYDGEFRYDRQPVGAVQGMAPDHVVYIGTVSKTLGPALRLGWMVLPQRLVAPLVDAKRYADHHTEVVGQLVLASLIDSHGYDRHIRASRLRYQLRREMLVGLVGPRGSRPRPALWLSGAAAGLHALLHLGSGVRETDMRTAAVEHGLAVGYLSDYWQTSGAHPQALVVGYGTPSSRSYPLALRTLGRVLDEVCLPEVCLPKA
jgi:GntR family transcriptional regulator/MocR family aminotransferase